MAFTERVTNLDEEELEALTRAATWYANYFAREIAAEAGETHAYAVEERRSYLALVRALGALGIRFPVPDELQPHVRQAA
jgi:hypothetical protein